MLATWSDIHKKGRHAYVHAQSLSCVWLFGNPGSVAHQATVSMGFSRQEYQSELSFPPPSCQPRDTTGVSCASCINRRILYHWATWKTQARVHIQADNLDKTVG